MTKEAKHFLHDNVWTIILGIVVLGLFLFLSPKISRVIVPNIKSRDWSTFQEKLVKNKTVDPQTYWEFREFYSPGVFTINNEGIQDASVKSFYAALPEGFQSQPELSFSQFKSPLLTSIDGLTSQTSIKEIVNHEEVSTTNIVTQSNTLLLYKINNNKYLLILLFTPEQMKKTNGFWNYQKDMNAINNRNWISTSIISLP